MTQTASDLASGATDRYGDLSVMVIAVPIKAVRPDTGIPVILRELASYGVLPVSNPCPTCSNRSSG